MEAKNYSNKKNNRTLLIVLILLLIFVAFILIFILAFSSTAWQVDLPEDFKIPSLETK